MCFSIHRQGGFSNLSVGAPSRQKPVSCEVKKSSDNSSFGGHGSLDLDEICPSDPSKVSFVCRVMCTSGTFLHRRASCYPQLPGPPCYFARHPDAPSPAPQRSTDNRRARILRSRRDLSIWPLHVPFLCRAMRTYGTDLYRPASCYPQPPGPPC